MDSQSDQGSPPDQNAIPPYPSHDPSSLALKRDRPADHHEPLLSDLALTPFSATIPPPAVAPDGAYMLDAPSAMIACGAPIRSEGDLLQAYNTMTPEEQATLLENINQQLRDTGNTPLDFHNNPTAVSQALAMSSSHVAGLPAPALPEAQGLPAGMPGGSAGVPALPMPYSMLATSAMMPHGDHAHMHALPIPGFHGSVVDPAAMAAAGLASMTQPGPGHADMASGADAHPPHHGPIMPPTKRQRLKDAEDGERSKNQNRNTSGVPEWSQAEIDTVMDIYRRNGCVPKWKPIADELKMLNAGGVLNQPLADKGLVRSNNAVMNKVKELLFKETGDVNGGQDADEGSDKNQKRNTSGVPEWNEAEINKVLEIWAKHGRKPEWKPISIELAAANADGSLNAELAAKGLHRTNNAVMNKVKELSGISPARRSRPRTLGNFAAMPAAGAAAGFTRGPGRGVPSMPMPPPTSSAAAPQQPPMFAAALGDFPPAMLAPAPLGGGPDNDPDGPSRPAMGAAGPAFPTPAPVLSQSPGLYGAGAPHHPAQPYPYGGTHQSLYGPGLIPAVSPVPPNLPPPVLVQQSRDYGYYAREEPPALVHLPVPLVPPVQCFGLSITQFLPPVVQQLE